MISPEDDRSAEKPAAPLEGAQEGFAGFIRAIVASGRWRLAWAMALSTVAAISQGAGLLLLVPLLDGIGISGSGSGSAWTAYLPEMFRGPVGAVSLYVAVVAIAGVASWARAIEATRVRLEFVDDLRRRVHAAVLGMEWSAFQRLRQSDVAQILTVELNRVGMGTEFLMRLSTWTIEVAVTLAVIVKLSPIAALFLIVPVGIAGVLAKPLNRRSRARGRALTTAARGLQADLDDDLTGMRLVKSMHLEEARLGRFAARATDLRSGQIEHAGAVAAASGAGRGVAAVAAAGGVAFAVRGLGMPVADAVVIALAFGRLMMVVLGVQEAWRNVLYALPAYDTALALLRRCRADAEPVGQERDFPPLRDAIVVEAVSFGHGPDRGAALESVDAVVPARSLTVIGGSSGAGKSTLADIVLGLLAPDSGRVLIDGRELDRAGRRAWRRRVGYVPQDSFLFHDTIRANLTVGADDVDEARLWEAWREAAIDDFVRDLPQGLDTVVGDRGSRLSGGERQRIALARALVRRPQLLVLDEPTSALDAESERQVLETLANLRGRVTMLVVTHRPAVLSVADRTLTLSGGKVVPAPLS